MGIKILKYLVEPKCFLGGYKLSTGCYTIALVGMLCIPCFQIIAWMDDDISDVNVNLIQYIILSIEVLQYILLAVLAKIANCTALKSFFVVLMLWAVLQWIWTGMIVYNYGDAEVIECRVCNALLTTFAASVSRGYYKELELHHKKNTSVVVGVNPSDFSNNQSIPLLTEK